jgi:pSer/pThr/pTyr-binding forkhead associated (FHA) protein
MPQLVVEHFGRRHTIALCDRAVIGRAPGSDVRIDHPAVSRTHAVIEAVNGDGNPFRYFLVDAGSHNGTSIGDRTLAPSAREALADGDRLPIGPATVIFRPSDAVTEPGSTDPSTVEATGDGGVTRTCECGATLYVPRSMLGQRARCRRCDRVLMLAEPKQICGVCQWDVPSDVEGGATQTCPSCGSLFHAECWRENRGCSAYGCAQVGALDQNDHRPLETKALPATTDEHDRPDDAADELTSVPQYELALLSGGIVGSLLGVISFGAPALVVAVVALLYLRRHGRRSRVPLLVATTAMSLLAAIGGVFVSIVWWFPGAFTW